LRSSGGSQDHLSRRDTGLPRCTYIPLGGGRCDLFTGGATSAKRELITRLPDHLPILVQACQPLWLVVNYGVYRSFTSVHHILPSWLPSALRLTELTSSHDSVSLVDTKGLRCPARSAPRHY
jgi:hypothetical protein